MAKYAQVIINKQTTELDRQFTYLIPDYLEDKIDIGYRVLVPFGAKNLKIEAYIVDITEECSLLNLKSISNIVDDYPVFSPNMLKLAVWMKEKYMCTLLDSLKCIAPTGISMQTRKIIKLEPSFNDELLRSNLQRKLVETIKDNNCEIEYDKLSKIFEKSSLSNILNSLLRKNIIKIENILMSGVKDKFIKVAYLNIEYAEASEIINNLSDKYSAQKRVLNILLENDYVAVSDLIKFADASYSAINSLYKKSILAIDEIEVSRDPYSDKSYTPTKPHNLTMQQLNALQEIIKSITNNNRTKFLLHGVTGSGKTEVYLQCIDFVLKCNGHAVVLVPEISLTPQMVERFKSRFGEKVAVMHSRLSLGERFDQWKKIKKNEVSVVVGARSAIFAPFDNLQLIIIDEEHEQSYKSDKKPKYHAKEIAEARGEFENCTLVLGSATPSVQTYYEAQKGIYSILKMNTRANECIMPNVEIVDMRKELENGNRTIFSRQLHQSIKENIEYGNQTILFLNRRGYSTFVSCRQCGLVLKCPYCSISLTYHSYNNYLMCHYCGHTEKNPSICPVCKSKYIKYFGTGTQKVEEEIRKLFPSATLLRMDVDTTGTKFAHQKILDEFKDKNINILIGTQMIAKGLDYPNITLVGVISADTSLNIDDFRSCERTFQLMTQVAGRSGRGQKEGKVIIQTYQPDEFSIQTAKNHDYETFYANEILMRKNLNYPPFLYIVSLIVSDSDNAKAKEVVFQIRDILENTLSENKDSYFEILSPTSAPLSRIKQLYRWRIILKIENADKIRNVLRHIENTYYNIVTLSIDVNPSNML